MADVLKPTLAVGAVGQATTLVTDALMAPAAGSGTVPVYASPSMIALMEAACVDCLKDHLGDGHTSLGVHLDVHHTAATPAGFAVTATAELTGISGRKLMFAVSASDGIDTIGRGTHTRLVVDRERFLARTAAKAENAG